MERSDAGGVAAGPFAVRLAGWLLVFVVGVYIVGVLWAPVEGPLQLANAVTAGQARALLGAFGVPVWGEGAIIRTPLGKIEVLQGCNAVDVVIMFAAAVLALPRPWPQRLLGLLSGTLAILCMNVGRVVALALIALRWPGQFDFAHVYVAQSVVILFTFLLFVRYARQTAREKPAG